MRRVIAFAISVVTTLMSQTLSYAASQQKGSGDGSGIWMNMWNYPTEDYEAYCLKLHAKGIRNLFCADFAQ